MLASSTKNSGSFSVLIMTASIINCDDDDDVLLHSELAEKRTMNVKIKNDFKDIFSEIIFQ